jgi:hypothetical protein
MSLVHRRLLLTVVSLGAGSLGRADTALYQFDGNLSSSTGQVDLEALGYPGVAGAPGVTFAMDRINGQDALIAQLARGTALVVRHGAPSNGGGIYVNQYSIVMDVRFPVLGNWISLYQTNDAYNESLMRFDLSDSNDGDWFVNPATGIGISGNYGGTLAAGTWYRLALVVDSAAFSFTSYIDGVQVQQLLAAPRTDGRWSLYGPSDPDPPDWFFLFADENAGAAEMGAVHIGSFLFCDWLLSPAEIAALGGPQASGIPPLCEIDFPLTNLLATGLEVTQAIQDLNQSLPLIDGKRTFVRFQVRSQSGTHCTHARLRLTRGLTSTFVEPINGIGGEIQVRTAPSRAVLDHSFLFELPDGYKQGTVTITGMLNPNIPLGGRDPVETTYSDNELTRIVSFESVPPVSLVAFRVGLDVSGRWGSVLYPDPWHVDRLASWLSRAAPVSDLMVLPRSIGTSFTTVPTCSEVNTLLAAIRDSELAPGCAADCIPDDARYYGMVDDRAGFLRGCARINGPVGSGPTGTRTWGWDFDLSYGDWYGGHELAHTYGRYHADYCGASAGAEPFPNPDGQISPTTTGSSAVFGFDAETKAVYDPTWKDVMTYCPSQWLSDFTYEALRAQFGTFLALEAEGHGAGVVDRLMVVGTIDPAAPQSQSVRLEPLFVIPSARELEPRDEQNARYAIVLRSGNGQELARYPFTAKELSRCEHVPPGQPDPGPTPALFMIDELVPFRDGTDSVEIWFSQAFPLEQVSAGSGRPQVRITVPIPGERLEGETVGVAWTASDTDGDPLVFLLQYSPDGGSSWRTVAFDIRDNFVAIDSRNLPASSQGVFRLLASDGVHTAVDTTVGRFTVPNHPPEVRIVEPEHDVTVVVGQTVALVAEASDPDEGSLAGTQVVWRSNFDGVLGTGAAISVADLSLQGDERVHRITVTATDSSGAAATDEVEVTVVSEPPGPKEIPDVIVVSPGMLSFRTASFESTATLAVLNEKPSSSISWTARSSVPWLSLSLSAGMTPAQVLVEFDGRTLVAGEHQAAITFDSAAGSTAVDVVVVKQVCPEAGDTHCSSLTVTPVTGVPGRFTARVTAADDTRNTAAYIFSATLGTTSVVKGPQAEATTVFQLPSSGRWLIAARADDDLACPDATPDASCFREVDVVFAGSGLQRPGDGNQDGILDVSDGIYVLLKLFGGGGRPLPCGDATLNAVGNRALLDMQQDGRVDLSDAIVIFRFLFSQGPPPSLGTECLRMSGCPNAPRCP